METAKAAGVRRSATGFAASVLRAVAAAILAGGMLGACMVVAPSSAWAADAEQAVQDAEVEISADGDAARMEGCDFAVEGFECSRTGSARDIDGFSYGYTYRLSGTDRVAIVNTADYAVLFIPRTVADEFGIEDEGSSQVQEIKTYLAALDENFSTGVNPLASQEEWKVLIADAEGTEGASLAVGDVVFTFGREISEGRFYVTIEGPDDTFDVKSEVRPSQMDSGLLVPAEGAVIAQKGGPLEQVGEFLSSMDYSPLWVTLKTCGVAIVFVFFLGLAAAYFTLHVSQRPGRLRELGSEHARRGPYLGLVQRAHLPAPHAALGLVVHRLGHGARLRPGLGRVRVHAVSGGQPTGQHPHHPHCHLLRVDERQHRGHLVLDDRAFGVQLPRDFVHQPMEPAYHALSPEEQPRGALAQAAEKRHAGRRPKEEREGPSGGQCRKCRRSGRGGGLDEPGRAHQEELRRLHPGRGFCGRR